MTAASLPRRSAPRSPWLAGARADVFALAVVLALLVPALAPLAADGVPATHDGHLHLQRLIALDANARDGALLSRWLPDLAYGYGQPLFNYYAPLAYAPAAVARIFGPGIGASFELATGLYVAASALAMYALGRALYGPVAALTAASVYAYLPYQMVDVYVRGAFAETAAFPWLPLLVLCVVQARRDPRARWPVALALSTAGLVLTHNVTALIAAPAMAALGLALFLQRGGGLTLAPGWLRPATGALLGLGLAAWFWLPALAERDLVQLGETIEPALFSSFFVRQWPPFRLDPAYHYREPVSVALGSPIFWPQLGLVQIVVTAAGIAAVRWARGGVRVVLAWAAGVALVCFALQLGPAEGLFGLVPLAGFIQFPWRLLCVLGLASSLLAGGLVAAVGPGALPRLLLGGAVVAASVLTAVLRLDPEPAYPDDRYLTAETVLRAELADYGLGSTHSGEYLPVASEVRNAARFRRALLEEPPARGSDAREPAAFRIDELAWRPTSLQFRVTAPLPDRVHVHQFAFTGWSARVDGQAVPLASGGRFGVLAVDVPAGSSVVELSWGWTPVRLVGVVLASSSLAGLALLVGRIRGGVALIAIGCVTLVTILALAHGSGRADADDSATSLRQPIDARLILTRSHLDRSRLASDRTLGVALHWLALDRLPSGYSATVAVESDAGAVHRARWAHDGLATRWERGELVRTPLTVRLPAAFPAGPARVALLVETPDTPASASPVRIDVGAVEVPPPPAGRPAPRGAPVVAGAAALDRHLVTSSGHWHEVRPGDWLDADLTLMAMPTDGPRGDLYAVLALRARDRETVSDPERLGEWFQPLPFWQDGDIWRQRVRLPIPAALASGEYEAVLRLYGRDLAAGSLASPGASAWRPRGRPVAELDFGHVTVVP